jgi:hypothetical protein
VSLAGIGTAFTRIYWQFSPYLSATQDIRANPHETCNPWANSALNERVDGGAPPRMSRCVYDLHTNSDQGKDLFLFMAEMREL